MDTSFLMAVFQLKIDILTEIDRVCDFRYEFCVLDKTIDELERLINGSLLSKRQAARLAIKLLKTRNIHILPTSGEGTVDDLLVSLDGYIVATVDGELKQRLKKKGTRILTIRQKKYVILG